MDGRKLLKILVHALAIGVVILFLMFVAMYCNGCGKQSAPRQYEGRMKYAGMSGTSMEVWIDTETGICYLLYRGKIVVMVDHDGKPFVANGWRDFSSDD